MFRVGQKVVCVDVSPSRAGRPSELVLGEVYEVTGLDSLPDSFGSLGVYIAGLPDQPFARHAGSYRATRFRPVVERKTDISIFTEMLTPKQKELSSQRQIAVGEGAR